MLWKKKGLWKKTRSWKKTGGLLCVALLTVSCAGEKPPYAEAISSKIIEPGYQLLAGQTSQLAKTAVTACGDATINKQDLKKLRHEWLVAMSAWEQAQVFRFGPIESGNIRSQFQFWPDPQNEIGKTVKVLLASDQPLTAAAIDQTGIAAQGLSALEYVLFDKENKLELFAVEGIAAQQRCFYIQHVSKKLADTSAAMAREWSAQGSYRQSFNSPETTPASTVVAVVFDSLLAELERLKAEKIAAPLGLHTEKKRPNVYVTEAWRSQESLALIRATVFMLGKILDDPQAGLLSLLDDDTAKQAVATKIRQQLHTVNAELQRINIRFNESLKSENGLNALSDLHAAVEALLNICKNELPQALGMKQEPLKNPA